MANNQYKLKNFRVFDQKGAEFEIAPITVLTGCNSSGKSSAIKSLMLLNKYFNTLKENYTGGKPINMTDYELLFNKGKHNLGTFQKTLSKYDKSTKGSPGMTFSWTKFSPLLSKDVEIEVEFVENHKNIFKNAVIKGINIYLGKKEIVALDFMDEFGFHVDYQMFKKHFFQFAQFVKHYDSIVEWLGFNQEARTPNSFKDEVLLSQQEGINMEAVESVVYAQKQLINRNDINLLVSTCRDMQEEAVRQGILLYLPILDWLKDVPKKEVSSFFMQKLGELELNDMKDYYVSRLSTLLKEFDDSKFKTFKEYYIETYEKQLTKCFSLKKEKVSNANKINDKDLLIKESLWHFNYSKLRGDENAFLAFKKMMLDGKGISRGFLDVMQNYLAFDAPLLQFHNFDFLFSNNLKDGQPSKVYEDFMFLANFCIVVDADFEKKRFKEVDYEPIAPQVAYLETTEYSGAVLYILAVIQDAVFNIPSFVENVDFVEAVRANVQRIYAFNQNADFNELILNYLNISDEKPPMVDRRNEKNIHFIITEENGEEIFNISVQEEDKIDEVTREGYKLGAFMRKWLRNFEIADDIVFENTSEGLGVLIYLLKGEEKELLADQGYGISQLLAIMLKIETVILKSEYKHSHPLVWKQAIRYRESTISIEEPETNLHPKFQSMLAEMFLDGYKTYNIRFIVETHSEYLIRKLQTLVAKKEISTGDVSLNYIYHHDKAKRPVGKPQVLNIKIKEDGRLSEPFGSGFFDEADNLAMDLLSIKSMN